MKKKFIALVALAAMVIGLLPGAAFAASGTDDINIQVLDFNSNTSQNPNVIISITGDDVRAGMRVTAYVETDDATIQVIDQALSANYSNTLFVAKTEIDGLDNAYNGTRMTVNVCSANGSEVYKSVTVNQQVVATDPKIFVAGVDDGQGTEDRYFTFKFDADYVPGSDDEVRLTAYDANGSKVGATQIVTITRSKLSDSVGDDGLRATENKSRLDFDEDAVSVTAVFYRDGKATDLEQEVSLAPRYGTYKSLALEFGDSNTVTRGETATGNLYYVNTQGQRYDITDAATYIYSDSDAVASKSSTKPELTITDDAVLGSTIDVTAYYGMYSVKTTLTVVDDSAPGDVDIHTSSARIGSRADLTFTLVDEDGEAMALDFQPTRVSTRWIDSSDEDAEITFVAGALTELDEDGTVIIGVTSDTVCTGKFELTFSDNSGHSYTVVSDTFAFTDGSTVVGAKEVELTINSNIMIVDGVSKEMDSLAVIDNSRTYVPLRAVAEAFGAQVKWEGADTGRITIDRGDVHIVMTANRLAYSINGEAAEMDVAPYISPSAGRAMVPVRFIAEAFDFNITTTKNADGTTAGVIFTAK